MLPKIKVLLGISDASKDQLLLILIQQALEEAHNYTHNNCIPDSIICEMVVYKYNRLGTEGVDSENYSGVSFNYSSDYPEGVMRHLKSFRKVRTL